MASLFSLPITMPGAIRSHRLYVLQNLSLLLNSGMPVDLAISSMIADVRIPSLRDKLAVVHEHINDGKPLYEGLQASGLASNQDALLIQIGEQTGKLSKHIEIIATQHGKDKEFSQRIMSALLYPLFVFILTGVVALAIMWVVLPRLATVFSQLSIELPLITRIMLVIASALQSYGVILVPATIAILIGMTYIVFMYPRTRHVGETILFSFSAIKTFLQEIELARFGYLCGSLLESGIAITHALVSCYESTSFRRYKRLFEHLREQIDQGHSISQSLQSYEKSTTLIPRAMQELIATAQRSGTLASTFLTIGSLYEKRTESSAKNVSVLLEPLLLVVVWIGVMGIAVAVILPYSLLGGINQ